MLRSRPLSRLSLIRLCVLCIRSAEPAGRDRERVRDRRLQGRRARQTRGTEAKSPTPLDSESYCGCRLIFTPSRSTAASSTTWPALMSCSARRSTSASASPARAVRLWSPPHPTCALIIQLTDIPDKYSNDAFVSFTFNGLHRETASCPMKTTAPKFKYGSSAKNRPLPPTCVLTSLASCRRGAVPLRQHQ